MTGSDSALARGLVLEVQRMSTEDGPGIRTTVFLKGCPLRCQWCHNPESISPRPQLVWMEARCIGCRICLEVCPNGALALTEQGMTIDREACQACGACANECPSTALELLGQWWTVDDLVSEVLKDRVYFEKSGGGVTISGGEVSLQADFAAAFLTELVGRGVHTAIDTCGLCSVEALDKLLDAADLVLFDLKVMDPARHKELTGASNERILENLDHLAERLQGPGRPYGLWIRTPIIPGATDDEANIPAIGRHLARLGGIVDRWDLCAFNNLARDKYARLGMSWPFDAARLMRKEDMERLTETARGSGVDPAVVQWSGGTRFEDGVLGLQTQCRIRVGS